TLELKEKRLIILQIKEALIKNKKYKIEIFSIDVYKAVLEKGVKNLEEFKEYLKSVGKNL
ncbi:MAG: hypothetical protein M1365_10940, partial [Actinobacteria bacterium]|nr:hypothetical protein [Actinomycetota bacterium]